MKTPEPPNASPAALSLSAIAEARQRAYRQARRAWADSVGRPYERKSDPRPPPGEVDADADE